MTQQKKLPYIPLTANALIILFELWALVLSIQGMGLSMFRYYTQDSNYLALISSIFFVAFACRQHFTRKAMLQWVILLRGMATCCLTLTFLIVLFVLIPMAGIASAPMMLLDGTMLFHHLLCPILSFVSFLFWEKEHLTISYPVLWSMVPTFIYAVIILLLNILKVLRGPYPFLYVYEQPLWMSLLWICIILGIAFLICFAVWKMKARK